jgi:hypothetical protein
MSDPYAPNLYQKLYEAAVHLFDKGKFKTCTKVAESNVACADPARHKEAADSAERDETLPPYYFIKNAILIVSAMDDWADAEVWKLAAEQAYITAFGKAKNKHSDNTREAFAELRYEFDQLDMFKVRDFEALVALGEEDEERYEEDEEEYGEDDYEGEDEDDYEGQNKDEDEGEDAGQGANASAETETIDFPIRQASKHDPKTNSVPAVKVDTAANGSPDTSSAPKIHQKKGGAYHMHAFTKSLSKGSSSSSARASIMDGDWKADDNLGR